jgi:DNA-binding FrmR family transcriptional regulator
MEDHIHTSHKQVLNRLSRIEGHVAAVRRMVAEGRDCPEVLVQMAAIRKAMDNTAKLILKDHIEHCLVHTAGGEDQTEVLKKLQKALDRYMG